jgi:hypothetical protein
MSGVRIPGEIRQLSSSKTFRTPLGPTQPPIKWVPGFFPKGKNRRVKLTTHLHLVPRMTRAILLTSYTPPWFGQEKFILSMYKYNGMNHIMLM